MNVLVACADAVFARMLELEFHDRRIGCLIATNTETMREALPSVRFAIVDAGLLPDDAEERKKLLPSGEIILFGYPDELARIPTQELTRYYVTVRPFVIEDFFASIFASAESGARYELRIQKRKNPADFLALDDSLHTAYYKGEKINLTPKEFALLRLLLQNRGKPVSREAAHAAVFGDSGTGTNVVDVYVNYLRAKIDNKFRIRLISTVRGFGYLIQE